MRCSQGGAFHCPSGAPKPTFPSVTATRNIPEGVAPSARPFNVVKAEPPADSRETHSMHDKSTSVVLSH